jgi:hypothetical protein
VFNEVTSGDYLISASMIGYSKYFTGSIAVKLKAGSDEERKRVGN